MNYEIEPTDVIESAMAGLESSLPAVIARREIPKYVGGTLTVGTLANLGKNGPPYFMFHKHATYEKKSFLAWYRQQIKSITA
jgi:hypothetical protein